MAKAFFVGWPLWAKMCWVLLCGIIIVIILGIFKIAYEHWKLRKYTTIAEAENARKREMEHRASVKARRAKETQVPFGVRAIESGIEVDGVWISRSNTPDTVRQGSPSSSILDTSKSSEELRQAAPHNGPELQMPQPTRGRVRGGKPKDPLMQQGRASISPENPARGRTSYQPKRSSGLRYSNSQDAVDMVTLSSFHHGQPNTSYQTTSDKTSPTSSTKSSEGSSKEETYINVDNQRSSAADILFDPAYLPPGRPRAQQIPRPSGFDSLPRKANQQAPEANQQAPEANPLLPHVRLSDMGMEWTRTQPDAEHHHPLQRQFSWEQDTQPELATDPFKTPTGSPLRGSAVDEPAYTGFFPPRSSAEPVPERRIEHIGDEALPDEEQHYASDRGFSQNKRTSQVVRKVNSGFEILRPGTLDQQRRSIDVADGTWDEEAGQKRHSRKLRRKRASSGRSSIFQEQI